MKPINLLFIFCLLCSASAVAQQRYLNEVFSDVTVTSNVVYGQNYSILKGYSELDPLVMDVYEPAGDTLSNRPVVIYMHAGDFLPILISTEPIGDMHDSSVVECCKRLARRGFVAVSMDYRIGWVPFSFDQDTRTGTLIQAVYRGVQDARTCIRYLRMDAALQGNTFKVDTGCITIGGEGSAGYISTSVATLDDTTELNLLKLLATTNNVNFGFVQGESYIHPYIMGDLEGLGGLPGYNNPNWPGYSSKPSMVFNLEGSLCDSSWLEAGDVPMVSFHTTNNPGSPYYNGAVLGPTGFVIWVTGSHDMIRIANQLGNNNVFNVPWNDPFTARADDENEGCEGLFPIVQADPGAPYYGQSNPWQWWDSLDLQNIAPYYDVSPAGASAAYQNGFLTNPDMSKTKAMHYIDTVMGYLVSRIVQNCALPGFISTVSDVHSMENNFQVFPNPFSESFQFTNSNSVESTLKIYDVEGNLLMNRKVNPKENISMGKNFPSGIYLLQLQTPDHFLSIKIIKSN